MSVVFDSVNTGDKLPELTKEPVTQLQMIRYAGASGDFNLIHTIEKHAREAGLEGTIAHGMLIMGMLGQMISSWAGIGNVVKYGASFKGMTRPGDILTARGEVTRKVEEGKLITCKVWMEDQNGDKKIEGKTTIRCS